VNLFRQAASIRRREWGGAWCAEEPGGGEKQDCEEGGATPPTRLPPPRHRRKFQPEKNQNHRQRLRHEKTPNHTADRTAPTKQTTDQKNQGKTEWNLRTFPPHPPRMPLEQSTKDAEKQNPALTMPTCKALF